MKTKLPPLEYATTFYKTKTLKQYAKAYLKVLPDNIDTLLSSGSSGSAIASAMIVLSNKSLKHRYIPKVNEYRHAGNYVDWSSDMAIVDDFIASGNTMKHIVDSVPAIYHQYIKCIVVNHILAYDGIDEKILMNKLELLDCKLITIDNE